MSLAPSTKKFCDLIAAGWIPSAAYIACFEHASAMPKAKAKKLAGELMATPTVAARLGRLRHEAKLMASGETPARFRPAPGSVMSPATKRFCELIAERGDLRAGACYRAAFEHARHWSDEQVHDAGWTLLNRRTVSECIGQMKRRQL